MVAFHNKMLSRMTAFVGLPSVNVKLTGMPSGSETSIPSSRSSWGSAKYSLVDKNWGGRFTGRNKMLPLTAGLSAVFSIEGLFCWAGAAPKFEYSNLVLMRPAIGFLWSNYAFYLFFFFSFISSISFLSFFWSGWGNAASYNFWLVWKKSFFNIRVVKCNPKLRC